MQQSGRILTLAITAVFALALAGCAMDDAMMTDDSSMMSDEMDAASKYDAERGDGERGMMGDGDMGDGDGLAIRVAGSWCRCTSA